MTEDDLKPLLDQQIEKLWADNREQLESLIRYADRCKAGSDRDGEQRYMAEYAELHEWCVDTSHAIYKPLVDLAMLRPGMRFVIPNPSDAGPYPAAIAALDQVRGK